MQSSLRCPLVGVHNEQMLRLQDQAQQLKWEGRSRHDSCRLQEMTGYSDDSKNVVYLHLMWGEMKEHFKLDETLLCGGDVLDLNHKSKLHDIGLRHRGS